MNAFLDTWNDPHARHALLVHVPIALGALAVVAVVLLALTGFKSRGLRYGAITLFALASMIGLMAVRAGHAAARDVGGERLSAGETDALREHASLARLGWVWPLIPAGLVGLTFVTSDKSRKGVGTLAAVASVGLAAWIGMTVHGGVRLVYAHGLGVPDRGSAQVKVDRRDAGRVRVERRATAQAD